METRSKGYYLSFEIGEVFREAWGLVNGIKGSVAGLLTLQFMLTLAIYVIFIIVMAPTFVNEVSKSLAVSPSITSLTTGDTPPSQATPALTQQAAGEMANTLTQKIEQSPMVIGIGFFIAWLNYTFVSALYLLGIKQALNLNPTLGKVLSETMRNFVSITILLAMLMLPWSLIHTWVTSYLDNSAMLLNILFYCIFFLGSILLTWVCFAFAIPLVIIKGYPISQAFLESIDATLDNWRKLILFSLGLFVIQIAGFLTLGILLFWTIPMAVIAHGIIFRKIFMNNAVVQV